MENQTEFGLDANDHGARMSFSRDGRWHNMEPLAEKYPWMSPYAFSANNPLKYVDPDGFDWYFNEHGHFLHDNQMYPWQVWVISQSNWDMATENGNNIDPVVLATYSSLFTEANITTESTLKIYDHFNFGRHRITDESNLDKEFSMKFHSGITGYGLSREEITRVVVDESKVSIGINVAQNKTNYSFNFGYNIENSFAHEQGHYLDAKRDPLKFAQSTTAQNEGKAFDYQMSHPSWKKTTQNYRKAIYHYQKKFFP